MIGERSGGQTEMQQMAVTDRPGTAEGAPA